MSRRLISGTVLAILIALGTVGCSDDSPSPSAGSTTTTTTAPSSGDDGDGGSAGAGDGSGDSGTSGGATDGATDGSSDGPTATPSPDAAEPTDASAESAQPTKNGKQTAIFGRVPGKASGACIAVGDRRDVRSGSIVGGPFDESARTWKQKLPGKPRRTARLYWVPLHAEKMPGVTVVATNRGTGAKVEETKDTFGEAEQWKFYDTYLELPTAGTWELRVKAGPDTGCFVMKIPG